ncbi:MAG: hypothetical protein M0O94_08765 [Bacteroidales bacterium]|nr:hypothetical protein [Bacteroidales bacterium]
MVNKRIVLLVWALMTVFVAGAQDYEDLLSRYSGENGNKFMQPVADVLGANLNSGWFHNAYLQPGIKPQFYVGVTTMFAFLPDNSKVFTATTEGSFFPATTVEDVPTIFGDKDGKIVEGPGSTRYYFPGGIELNYIPFATPQLSIGSFFGTDLSIRYASVKPFVSSFELEDVNEINALQLFGWGLRHSVSQYLGDLIPVDLTLGYYRTTLTSRDYLNVYASLISIQASYRQSIFTFYGGIGIESSGTRIEYESVTFDLKANNSVRATLGACINAGPVKINAEYNASAQSTFSAGLGIGINELEKQEKETW